MPPSSARLLRLVAPPGGSDSSGSKVERSDAELVILAREKDPRAAGWIWDWYAPMVRAIVCRSVGPQGEIDDLIQDVFVGFFRNVSSLRDPSALKSFLVGIALRTARTSLRKKRVRRWLHLTSDGDAPEVASTRDDPRSHEALRRLYKILDGLDDRDRLAFVLRHGEGYELTEAAAALDVSLATVKRCLQRAEEHVLSRAKNDALLSAYTEEGQ